MNNPIDISIVELLGEDGVTGVKVKHVKTGEEKEIPATGYFAAIGPVAGDRFTDLVDNYSVPLGSPIVPPFVGAAKPSRHLVYVNAF